MERRNFLGTLAAMFAALFVASPKKRIEVPEWKRYDAWEWHEAGWEYDPQTRSWTYYSRVFDVPLPNTPMVKK